jgi:hypothetical protein
LAIAGESKQRFNNYFNYLEQSRVANSPAVELPPNGFEDADLKVRQSRLISPARTRHMLFWRSKSKSTSDRSGEPARNDRNNNSKSVDQAEPAEEYRTITTAHITTKPPPPSPPTTDNNGNTVEKTPKTERGYFLLQLLPAN